MDLFSNPLGIHERALQARSQRMELIAQNIANADTPQYKARDLDFKQVMNQQLGQPIRATDDRHYAIAETTDSNAVKFRVPFNTSFDDNTVEISVEAGHDLHQSRLTGAVWPDDADLGAKEEREPDPAQQILAIRGALLEALHVVDEFLGHTFSVMRVVSVFRR